MKKLLIFVLILWGAESVAQFPTTQTIGAPKTLVYARGGLGTDSGMVYRYSFPDTTSANLGFLDNIPGIEIRVVDNIWIRNNAATRWLQSGGGSTFDGNRPITRDFATVTGVNLGTADIGTTLETLLYPSQVPTASLTGGGDYEIHSAGTFGATLNWTAGRQASTNPLSTIVVGGVSQAFVQPSAPGTVAGTKAVTVTWNTNVTYTNTVTTTDSKVASATTAFNFYPKRYWGISAGSPPSSAVIVAATGGGGELTTSKSKSTFVITVAGTNQYVYYAYPSSYGALSSIIISGLESIGAFTSSTVSVTNASGYVQNYLVYTSNNLFNNTTISFNSVN